MTVQSKSPFIIKILYSFQPRTVISVAENVKDGYEIQNAIIIGTDLDTTADLEFSINWESSYATKPGISKVDASDYKK